MSKIKLPAEVERLKGIYDRLGAESINLLEMDADLNEASSTVDQARCLIYKAIGELLADEIVSGDHE